MVSTVTTSTNANATAAYNGRRVDHCQDGTLWTVQVASNFLTFAYSKDNGSTWTPLGTGSANALAYGLVPSLFIDLDDYAHLVFRQDASNGVAAGADVGGARTVSYTYYMRGTPNANRTAWTWTPATLVTDLNQDDVPDIVAFRNPTGGGWSAAIVCSQANSAPQNATLYKRFPIAADGTIGAGVLDGAPANRDGRMGTLGSYQQGVHTYPSIDFNHTGDGKTVAGGTPHLYVGWNAGQVNAGNGVRFRKAVYSGGAWTWNPERELDPGYFPVGNDGLRWQQTFFDGTRAVTVGYLNNTASSSDAVVRWDRDASDTTTTGGPLITTPAAGDVLAYGSATYDRLGSVYFLGRSGSGCVSRRWVRSTGFDAPVVFDASPGTAPYISVRRGYAPGSIDYVWTDGTAAPYSVQFDRISINVAPNAPALVGPIGNASFDRAVAQRFSWTFSDPDASDTQSKFDLQYRVVGASSWVGVTGTTTNPFADFDAGTFAAGSYEWQVRTYDAAGVVGPWSGSAFFTAANAPAGTTISSPVSGGTVSLSSATVTWSAAAQTGYQVRTVADNAGTADPNTVYTDTGLVIDSGGRSRTVNFAVNNRVEHIQVRVQYNGLYSNWADVRVSISFTPPASPAIVCAGSDGTASITVAITNPAPSGSEPVAVGNSVEVRRTRQPMKVERKAVGLPPNTTWTWATPASGVDYEFRVTTLGSNGSSSQTAWSGSSLAAVPAPTTPPGSPALAVTAG